MKKYLSIMQVWLCTMSKHSLGLCPQCKYVAEYAKKLSNKNLVCTQDIKEEIK